jgi:mannose-6-phosphate isomerase-like protein (cupin superfamily)
MVLQNNAAAEFSVSCDRGVMSINNRIPVTGPARARVGALSLPAANPLRSAEFRSAIGELLSIDELRLRVVFDPEPPVVILGPHTIISRVPGTTVRDAFCCLEMVHQGCYGPPMHRHDREDELFVILEGRYRFEVDGDRFELGPGGTLLAPQGSIHTFVSCESTGRTLVFAAPGGFDRYFEAVGAIPREEFSRRLADVSRQFGIQFVGPPLEESSSFWDANWKAHCP